jgi:hypothetical protein
LKKQKQELMNTQKNNEKLIEQLNTDMDWTQEKLKQFIQEIANLKASKKDSNEFEAKKKAFNELLNVQRKAKEDAVKLKTEQDKEIENLKNHSKKLKRLLTNKSI